MKLNREILKGLIKEVNEGDSKSMILEAPQDSKYDKIIKHHFYLNLKIRISIIYIKKYTMLLMLLKLKQVYYLKQNMKCLKTLKHQQ